MVANRENKILDRKNIKENLISLTKVCFIIMFLGSNEGQTSRKMLQKVKSRRRDLMLSFVGICMLPK